MSNFLKRFLTSIGIVVVLCGMFALRIFLTEPSIGPVIMDLGIMFISVMALNEVGKAISTKYAKPIMPIVYMHLAASYVIIIIGLHTDWLPLQSRYSTFLYTAIELPLMFIFMFIVAFVFNQRIKLSNLLSTSFLMFYPTALLVFLFSINNMSPHELTTGGVLGGYHSLGVYGLALLILVSCLSDVCAYLVGSTVKGPKLCPNLSPNKTVSGAVGGMIGGMIGAFIVFGVTQINNMPALSDYATVIPFWHYFIIGVFGSVFTQLGDLAASYVKRQCEIKDFGSAFPGHGGFMDRLDGLLFNATFIYFYVMVVLIWII